MVSERPLPDPAKLLEDWMAFENGEEEPGRVLANLKKGGLRDVLEALAAGGEVSQASEANPAASRAEVAEPGAAASAAAGD